MVKAGTDSADNLSMTLGAALAGLWIWLGLVGGATAFGAWAACMIRFDQGVTADGGNAQPVSSTGPAFPRFSGLGVDYWARAPEAAVRVSFELVSDIDERQDARDVQSPTPARRSA